MYLVQHVEDSEAGFFLTNNIDMLSCHDTVIASGDNKADIVQKLQDTPYKDDAEFIESVVMEPSCTPSKEEVVQIRRIIDEIKFLARTHYDIDNCDIDMETGEIKYNTCQDAINMLKGLLLY